ncbi:MAG: hypothetical protein K2Y05_01220 [Hyphomicrobiaceae bacterium]|nr:hypothetical protein [Hyphomicrobiaceae bacterium]
MAGFLTFAMASAALLFIALSATVNALFLSSIGRTPVEVALLAALSIAADVAKAGLPVVAVRAAMVRAWGHLVAATLMLALVVMLSLASGIGFAALTRNAATSAREAKAQQVITWRRDLFELDVQLQRLAPGRSVAIVDALLDGLRVDRRWSATKGCTEITSAQARLLCTEVASLNTERVQSVEQARLETLRSTLRQRLATHSEGTIADSDPQSSAIGAVLGIDSATPRRVLSVFLAIVIETGSVLLVFLTLGPALAGWRPPGDGPITPPQPANIPQANDVARWQRSQGKAKVSSDWLGAHAR